MLPYQLRTVKGFCDRKFRASERPSGDNLNGKHNCGALRRSLWIVSLRRRSFRHAGKVKGDGLERGAVRQI